MNVFDILTMVGGLCLFLFGMNVMGDALERRAGNSLKTILGKLTKNRFTGFLTGLGVTSIIQSSSATTVMVVGFVNSGIMSLRQSISVIMGANIGTTVTAWILSLAGIEGGTFILDLLKPMSFTPLLALIGIAYIMFGKSSKKKDTGMILLGFATLMYGMNIMSGAVEGLKNEQWFCDLFVAFSNPVLGVIAGAILTAIIQSSSASVGILQALSSTGAVTYGAAVPIIMGQNIGTCVTALLSSFGTNRNAKRAAVVHLSFNVIGTVVWLTVFSLISYFVKPLLFSESATYAGIAIAHSLFNIACTILLLPMAGLLEKLAIKLVPDKKDKNDVFVELDDRLLATPAIALDRCSALVCDMADICVCGLKLSLEMIQDYNAKKAEIVRQNEEKADHYEDILGTYLVKLSGQQINEFESASVSKLIKVMGDLERISDHSINVLEAVEELKGREVELTQNAKAEIKVLCDAVAEAADLTRNAFVNNSVDIARLVEPLEQVVDELKRKLRNAHIARLKAGTCSIEVGFIWIELITNLERISDHCSNIAVCVMDASENNMNMHASLRRIKDESPDFTEKFDFYARKYMLDE